MDVFLEVFPIETSQIPEVAAYTVAFGDLQAAQHNGGKLAYRLSRTFGGRWVWAENRLLTDTPVSAIQLEITFDLLKQQTPELYASLQGVEEDSQWSMSAWAQAAIVQQGVLRETENEVRVVLNKHPIALKNAVLEREPALQTWIVANQPALSLSIRSYIRYPQTLADYLIAQNLTLASAVGLRVMDKTSPSMTGTIVQTTGILLLHRERLLSLTKREIMQTLIQQAPDHEPVFLVEAGSYRYEYIASALWILMQANPDDAARFGFILPQIQQGQRIRPEMRAGLVQNASDVLKQRGIIGRAYSTRTHPELFAAIDFMPNLIFGGKKVLPYRPATMAADFTKGGLYRLHPRFAHEPIRIAVINTLDDIADDFIEALRRHLEKNLKLQIEMQKARKVRVVSADNLKSAVRVIEKENANIVLAFFKEESDEEHAALIKSLTLGKGIASHIIHEATLNNPDAMPLIMLALLGKTGSLPFVLAEPLEYADYIVGLGMVRESTKQGDRVTALSRIYRSDGEFVRYVMDSIELERGEPVPYVLLQTLFPQEVFAQQRVIIHHDGRMPAEQIQLLTRWQTVLGAHLTLVEISQQHVPRLYGLDKGKILQPPWGSLFKLNDQEAFIIASEPPRDSTAQPLQVRVVNGALPIEQAVYSVLAWTMLHYGAAGNVHKLPVTIQYAEDIAVWLAKGMLPAAKEGDVPFWL